MQRGTPRVSVIAVALLGFGAFGCLASPASARTAGRHVQFAHQATATAATPVASVERVTPVVSYGGWAAWSRYETKVNAYQLVVRSPKGVLSAVGAPQAARPFEVGLGPLASGGVGAVLARCVEPIDHRGCVLKQLAIESADPTETALPVPGGGSLFRPALWKGTIAFMRSRSVPKHPVPSELLEWRVDTKTLTRLALPSNRYYGHESEESETRETENAQGTITGLTLNGTQVAYVRVAPWGEWTRSDVWTQSPGKRAKLMDWIGTGGASDGTRTYVSPVLLDGWLYLYRQYHEMGEVWVRFKLGAKTTQKATVDLGDTSRGLVLAATPLQGGLIWSLQNSEEQTFATSGSRILLRAKVAWTTLRYRASLVSSAAGQEPRRSRAG
jgi:hypothetical protein